MLGQQDQERVVLKKQKRKRKRKKDKQKNKHKFNKKKVGGGTVKVKTVLTHLILTRPIQLRGCHWGWGSNSPQIQCSNIIQNQARRDQDKPVPPCRVISRKEGQQRFKHCLQSFSSQALGLTPKPLGKEPRSFSAAKASQVDTTIKPSSPSVDS